MPHTVEGFMKKQQREKFVRNRDVKLKDKEIRQEEKIQKGMSEGICPQCRDKLQWRFQYNKYKPLKKVAGCTGCRQKKVTKAYRTLCDGCAAERNVCPSCCANIIKQLTKRKERDEVLGVDTKDEKEVSRSTAPEMYSGQEGIVCENDYEMEEDTDEIAANESVECDEGTGNKKLKVESNDIGTSSTTQTSGGLISWDENKFGKIASSKYSKSRVVGSAEDNIVNVFDFSNSEQSTDSNI